MNQKLLGSSWRSYLLESLFIGALLGANVVAVKLMGTRFVQSAGVIAYPLTFIVTDVLGEVYGKRRAARLVWMGFVAQLMFLVMVTIGRFVPYPSFWGGQDAYVAIVGLVPRIILGSLTAYLLSQYHDVFAFHFWKKKTNGKHLWLRNNASTMVSQAIDTVVFVIIAFAGVFKGASLWGMIWIMYVTKLAIAVVDTPVVYLLVRWLRKEKHYDDGKKSAPTETQNSVG